MTRDLVYADFGKSTLSHGRFVGPEIDRYDRNRIRTGNLPIYDEHMVKGLAHGGEVTVLFGTEVRAIFEHPRIRDDIIHVTKANHAGDLKNGVKLNMDL